MGFSGFFLDTYLRPFPFFPLLLRETSRFSFPFAFSGIQGAALLVLDDDFLDLLATGFSRSLPGCHKDQIF